MVASLAYRAADLASRVLPAPAADALAVLFANLAFTMRLPARAMVEANLARLLPGRPEAERSALGRAAFQHFAIGIADFLRLARISPADVIAAVEIRGREHLMSARASGRGVIVLSAHVGSWEWGAARLAAEGAPLRIAARPHADPSVDALFRRVRAGVGVGTLTGAPLFASVTSALRRHEWVALMGDRGAAGSAGASVCAWAAALARRTGALVLPAVMVRLGARRHALCFEAPLAPDRCAGGGYRDVMRSYLERHAEQWAAFEPLPEGLA